ncbi:MAG: complex I subunit 5 family protein [bacterium]|nr:complex I subunit 5 family protein [bacterium]
MEGNLILLFLVLFPMVGAIASYLIGRANKEARNYFVAAVAVIEFFVMAYLFVTFKETTAFVWKEFCGRGMYLELDGFRVLNLLVAAFMWMMTTLFSKEYFKNLRNRNRYYLFTLLTLGATVGVFLSADLFTTFIFFEIMSFTSYVWVAHDETEGSMRAAATYLAVGVIGGLVMLMGLFLLYTQAGTLQINELYEACHGIQDKTMLYVAGGCILVGFGAKAGMFPLHIWLPKAYPAAPAPATALLSGILSKTGIYGILVVSAQVFLHDAAWGNMILVFGVITMFLGAFLAVFSIDMKRTLALSSMSQIGFILVGVGMQGLLGHHNALAVRGTLLHMINHSFIKLVLFMIAGVVFLNLGKLDLNSIRGFGRKKLCLMGSFLMAGLGVMGIPLWNGYISKTLLHESIVEYIHLLQEEGTAVVSYQAVEWIFLFTGGLTIAYIIKLFVAIFVEKNDETQEEFDAKKNYMSAASTFAIVGSAVIIPILGFLPTLTQDRIADLGQGFMHGENPAHAVHYFNFENLKGAIISLVIGLVVYFVVVRLLLMKKDEAGRKVYINAWPAWLDLENIVYRPIILVFLPFAFAFVCRVFEKLTDGVIALLGNTVFTPIMAEKQKSKKENEFKANIKSISSEIRGSITYALLMYGIGMVVILYYLLR